MPIGHIKLYSHDGELLQVKPDDTNAYDASRYPCRKVNPVVMLHDGLTKQTLRKSREHGQMLFPGFPCLTLSAKVAEVETFMAWDNIKAYPVDTFRVVPFVGRHASFACPVAGRVVDVEFTNNLPWRPNISMLVYLDDSLDRVLTEDELNIIGTAAEKQFRLSSGHYVAVCPYNLRLATLKRVTGEVKEKVTAGYHKPLPRDRKKARRQ